MGNIIGSAKKEYAGLLTNAFQIETNDVFVYQKEAQLFKKKIAGGERLAALFESLSKEELRHADIVATRLIELGESPRWHFSCLQRKLLCALF